MLDVALADLGLPPAAKKRDMKTRWLSHLLVFERVLEIYPAQLLALERAPSLLPSDKDMNSRSVQMELHDVSSLPGMHLPVILLRPLSKLIKLLRARARGASTLKLAVQHAQVQLRRLVIEQRTAFTSEPFVEFDNLLKCSEASRLSTGIGLEAERVTLYIKCRDMQGNVHKWQAQAVPHDSDGEPVNDGTERMHPDALPSIAQRCKAAAVAGCEQVLPGLRDKFPDMVLVDTAGYITADFLAAHLDEALRSHIDAAPKGQELYLGDARRIGGEQATTT